MGMVITSKRVPLLTAPTTVIQAGTLTVGSVVKLMEGGTAVDYLVVNQGIPSNSDLYDASCNGTWLLRKDVHSNRAWGNSNVTTYENSTINTWLNGEFFNTLGSVEQITIKQVKIPYNSGSTEQSGANGLLCKVFLLGGYEVGIGGANDAVPQDGAKLDYFNQNTGADSKRIAYLNGSADSWWLRSRKPNSTTNVWLITSVGQYTNNNVIAEQGIRPALIIPSTAKFDETTLQLKGVA